MKVVLKYSTFTVTLETAKTGLTKSERNIAELDLISTTAAIRKLNSFLGHGDPVVEIIEAEKCQSTNTN